MLSYCQQTSLHCVACSVSRFHLMEYPDYKYQPRKRPASDASASGGSRPRRRPIGGKKLRAGAGGGAKYPGGGAKRRKSSKCSKLVPRRAVTPMSSADSDLSFESYLSSDWSVASRDLEEEEEEYKHGYDLDLIGTRILTYVSTETDSSVGNPNTSAGFSRPSASIRSQVLQPIREPVAILPASCGRSSGTALEAFDWMEDYMTPEVVDLLADDWLVAADNICLRDVAVM